MTAIHPRLENIFESYLGDGRPLIRKRGSAVTHPSRAEIIRTIIDLRDPVQVKRALLTTRTGSYLRGQFPDLSLDDLVEVLASCRKQERADTTNERTAPMMKRSDKIEALVTIAKADGGLVSVLKAIVNAGEPVVSESEVIKLIADAVARDGESDAQAFARAFEERGKRGGMVRAAIEATKGMTINIIGPAAGDELATEGMMRRGVRVQFPDSRAVDAGDDDESAEGIESDDDQDEAMAELEAATDKLHKAEPHLTREQCFAKVFTSQQYRHVAERERHAGRAKLRKAMGFA